MYHHIQMPYLEPNQHILEINCHKVPQRCHLQRIQLVMQSQNLVQIQAEGT